MDGPAAFWTVFLLAVAGSTWLLTRRHPPGWRERELAEIRRRDREWSGKKDSIPWELVAEEDYWLELEGLDAARSKPLKGSADAGGGVDQDGVRLPVRSETVHGSESGVDD